MDGPYPHGRRNRVPGLHHRYGGADYLSTPGNLGWQMLFRDLGDGTSEVTTLSWWTDLAVVKAFAGEDYERARYYPEDDRFLLDRPPGVDHFRVADGSGPLKA